MTVCPVCEHPQAQGDTCDNCGKQLVAMRAVAAPVSALPELEVTTHSSAGNVVSERVEGLEVTQVGAVGNVPVERLPDWERTDIAARDLRVQPEKIADLDLGREESLGERTQLPSAIACRYCGNQQDEGLLCNKCGMRLPKVRTEAAAGAAKGNSIFVDTVWTRCTRCGARARGGQPCGDCGHAVPMPESA